MKQKQLKICLPLELRQKLNSAAAVHNHSVAMEIRERIEQNFQQEEVDPGAWKDAMLIYQMVKRITRR